ncbi:hypothetical protein BDW22DRAFT_1433224 [Trametopsis cervina]|nr:hypothetical protein BDW22DRAFT_1433224 [Trametopsis cervina]
MVVDDLPQPSGLFYLFRFSTLSTSSNSLAYQQPPATELLILLSFVFLLNVVRVVADFLLHAGIIAEICLGIVYGTPIAGVLPQAWELTFTVFGYIGLIGIVFEGKRPFYRPFDPVV